MSGESSQKPLDKGPSQDRPKPEPKVPPIKPDPDLYSKVEEARRTIRETKQE